MVTLHIYNINQLNNLLSNPSNLVIDLTIFV